MNLDNYDKYIVAFSGGKDSTACFLQLLELGVPKSKIELWHQCIDGDSNTETFMDWEVTEDYCRKFAEHFGVPIYFSWKAGGFKREMFKDGEPTAETLFECPDGQVRTAGGKGKPGTRLMFPQVSPDLSVRWCSGYLKIDVCTLAIRNQERFKGIRTVVISGERGEESPNRARYNMLEPDKADLRNGKKFQRHVDRARPILEWTEEQVWNIIEKHQVVVHPCYYMGFSRCSCKFCIFGNADQFASAYYISPQIGDQLIQAESGFGVTLKRNISLVDLINKGMPYESISDQLIDLSTSHEYHGEITTENWTLPSGAYGEGCGPQ